jgi:uncharacterized protein (DUF934 family)
MQIIKDRQIIEDNWLVLPADAELPATGDYFVGLSLWNDSKRQQGRSGKLSLILRPGDDVATIQNLAQATIIAIEFPKFTDGRGYSMARLLRERYGFTGELRAVGNVLRDQLLYMQRCGFTSFALQPGKDLQGALAAFEELSVRYQADANDSKPLFRRVARGG